MGLMNYIVDELFSLSYFFEEHPMTQESLQERGVCILRTYRTTASLLCPTPLTYAQ